VACIRGYRCGLCSLLDIQDHVGPQLLALSNAGIAGEAANAAMGLSAAGSLRTVRSMARIYSAVSI